MSPLKATTLLVAVSVAFSSAAYAITTDECPVQQGNPFNLSQANANALVALACTGLSHIGNERNQMKYEDSATMFHLWTTTGNYNSVHVEGYCAVPLKDMREGRLSAHRIDLTMSQDPKSPVNTNILVDGVIGGKSLSLNMRHNQFLDQRCAGGEGSYVKLSSIGLGLSLDNLGRNLYDMVRSGSTFAPLTALETQSWVSAAHGGGAAFPDFGVQYDMGQSNGRHLGIVATQGDMGNIIDVRSAVILNYHDGSGYFDLRKDSHGMVSGFSLAESMNVGDNAIFTNNKYQASNVRGGSQIMGCSSLIYESETSLPRAGADLNICRRHMEQFTLGKGLQPSVEFARELTPVQQKEKFDRLQILDKASRYLNLTQGIVKAYTSRPNSFEQGRVPWSANDISRGFVITQRNTVFDQVKQIIVVVESRTTNDGGEKTIRYQLKITDFK